MARPLRTWLPRLVVLALLLSLPPSANAQTGPIQWRALDAPGPRISLLAGSPDGKMLYAVAVAEVNRAEDQTQWQDRGLLRRSDALYSSADGGAGWRAVTNDLPPAAITALHVERNGTLWVGLQHAGDGSGANGSLWRSPDQGRSWQQVELDGEALAIRSIVQDAGGDLYVGALARTGFSENVVYRSASAGASWTRSTIVSGENRPGHLLLELIPHSREPAVLFATMQNGLLYRSTDAGATWTISGSEAAPEGADGTQLVFLAGNRTALLIRGMPRGLTLQRSVDSGATWTDLAAAGLGKGVPLASGVLEGGNLLLSTDTDTYRSIDGGRSWQALEGVLSGGRVRRFASLGAAAFAATDYGVFASRDAGALWGPQSTGIPANASIAGVLTHPSQPGYLVVLVRPVGSSEARVMLASLDGGRAWNPVGPGALATNITAAALDPSAPETIYAAGSEHVSRTTDGGLTWESKSLPFSRRHSIVVAPSAPQNVYLAGAPALHSMDGGRTWVPVADPPGGQQVDALAVDPADARHVWAGTASGVVESRDSGSSWTPFGLDGQAVMWLVVTGGQKDAPLSLYAGIKDGGIGRSGATTADWQPASSGLPAGSNIAAFAADPRSLGLLWAARNGGGLYGSSDSGATWQNAGNTLGENLVGALAIDYASEGGVVLGTATAGIWLLGGPVAAASAGAASAGAVPAEQQGAGIDARIEVLWPHNFAPIEEARLANIGLRLFAPGSLRTPACAWHPEVMLWGAVGTNPAAPLKEAEQRAVDGQPFPYWNVNDVDVSAANDPNQKLYFIVKVEGIATATSVWAHAADARTFFPSQDVPSGIATGPIEEVDARIQIVWPHDSTGNEKSVSEASLANVAVALFKHGTRLSVPQNWRPQRLTLYGAWNQEVSRPLSKTPVVHIRQAGAITYPVWEFDNIAVGRAMGGTSRLYLWADVQGAKTYPTIWAHGVDSRTLFPAQDEPVQGCTP